MALVFAFGIALCAGTGLTASAATLCVNPAGTSGCYSTISDAVAAASDNDTIKVAPGTYTEDVVIGKSLSLIGHNAASTIIDASGLSNGIYVDGLDNPELSNVVVAGFTVKNANYEGILVTNASNVLVWRNRVVRNDQKFTPGNPPTCPGVPSFETAENFDCGEGIHLLGVDHSTVTDNIVKHNAGGILVSDDTAPAHDNLIKNNVSSRNPYDCGITLASHPTCGSPPCDNPPYGVYDNTIAHNVSSHNGAGGAGAGVGIFDSVPGTANYSNVVIGNVLTDNGLPGVTFHSHTSEQNLTNNMVVGNDIAGNGKDTQDAATSGPTGINVFGVSSADGTVISQNRIHREDIDIAVNNPADIQAHLNDLRGKKTGVDNSGTGTVNATENWWGCSGGPGQPGCSDVSGSGTTLVAPWLKRPY